MVRLILIGWAMLALVFGIYDLQISIALYHPDSGWAYWLDKHGQKPAKLLILLSLFLLPTRRTGDRFADEIRARLFMVVCAFTLAAILKFPSYYWPLWIPVIVIAQLGMYHCCPLRVQSLIRFCQLTLLIFIASFILIELMKDMWGRMRFHELGEMYEGYTPWYLPQGNNGFHSFPSGHTAFGWMLLPLLTLAGKTSRIIRFALLFLVTGWGLLVAFSRVWLGDHYASDVLFSSGLVIMLYLWFSRLLRARETTHS